MHVQYPGLLLLLAVSITERWCARHGPWSVRKRFSRDSTDHTRQGQGWSKPGYRIAEWVTIARLTAEANNAVSSTGVMCDHIGCPDASRTAGQRLSASDGVTVSRWQCHCQPVTVSVMNSVWCRCGISYDFGATFGLTSLLTQQIAASYQSSYSIFAYGQVLATITSACPETDRHASCTCNIGRSFIPNSCAGHVIIGSTTAWLKYRTVWGLQITKFPNKIYPSSLEKYSVSIRFR